MGLELAELRAEFVKCIRVQVGTHLVLLELADAKLLHMQLGEAICDCETDTVASEAGYVYADADPYIEVEEVGNGSTNRSEGPGRTA